MPSVSVVIPAFNEERRIVPTLQAISEYLRHNNYEYEIIVVDDGSNDDTVGVVRKLPDERIRIISYGGNRGKGFAVRQGVLSAAHEWILFSDADLSTPIAELASFLKDDTFDVIIGSRALPQSVVEVHQVWHREFSGKAFNLLVRLFAVKGICDTQCGFKLFRREAARRIFSKQRLEGFGFDVEVLYLTQKYGYRIKEAPVVWRNDASTKVRLVRDAMNMFADIIRIRYNDREGLYDA